MRMQTCAWDDSLDEAACRSARPLLCLPPTPAFVLVLQINLQYAYAERLGDDRGVTYGFCGFTTGTGDGLMVSYSTTKGHTAHPIMPASSVDIHPWARRWCKNTPSASPTTRWPDTCLRCEQWLGRETGSPALMGLTLRFASLARIKVGVRAAPVRTCGTGPGACSVVYL